MFKFFKRDLFKRTNFSSSDSCSTPQIIAHPVDNPFYTPVKNPEEILKRLRDPATNLKKIFLEIIFEWQMTAEQWHSIDCDGESANPVQEYRVSKDSSMSDIINGITESSFRELEFCSCEDASKYRTIIDPDTDIDTKLSLILEIFSFKEAWCDDITVCSCNIGLPCSGQLILDMLSNPTLLTPENILFLLDETSIKRIKELL